MGSKLAPQLEELLRFPARHQCLVVPVEHGRGMTQVECRLGLVLLVVQPMAGRCMVHAVARPREDTCLLPEAFHAAFEVELRPDKWPIAFFVTFR